MLEHLLERIDQHQFETFTDDIKLALSEHREWLYQINYAIVSKSSLEAPEFVADDAHKHCNFGCWLAKLMQDNIFRQGSFLRIEVLHEELHRSAKSLMEQLSTDSQVDDTLYLHFLDVQKELFDLMLELLEFTVVNRNQFDPTTKLMNRRSADSILAHEKHRLAHSDAAGCCIVLADLDHFKDFNDNYGHDVGDRVLEHVATTFQQAIRRHDSVARFGGEEFLFVLPDMNIKDAEKAIERVRKNLAKSSVEHQNEQLTVTASFGITQLCKACDITKSIKRADIALYEAKAHGRNCTVSVNLMALVRKYSEKSVQHDLTEDQIRAECLTI